MSWGLEDELRAGKRHPGLADPSQGQHQAVHLLGCSGRQDGESWLKCEFLGCSFRTVLKAGVVSIV